MPTIIDITPVSSHTSARPTEPPREDRGRLAIAVARLKRRLRVMAIVLTAVAAVAGALTIGLLIFLVLLGTAAVLTAATLLRNAFAGRPGATVDRRR